MRAGPYVAGKVEDLINDDALGANKLIGKTVRDAGDNDATVRVRLSQGTRPQASGHRLRG